MGKRGVLFRLILSLFWASLLFCEELPRPSSQNRLLFSMTYSLNGSAEEIAAMHARDKKEREQTQLDPAIVDPMTGIPHAELKKLLEQ